MGEAPSTAKKKKAFLGSRIFEQTRAKLKYVKTEENKSKTIESVKKLSGNVDERWS